MTTVRAPALALLLAVASLAPGAAGAQPPGDAEGAPAAERLAVERGRQRTERLEEGVALVIFGGASIVAGALVAAIGHADEATLSAGLGTIGWGAINVPFGIPMMDPAGSAACEIEAERALRGRALRERREDLARDQQGSAAVFAFNGGLDVFYVATGVLLAILGHLAEPALPALTGYGIAMGAQGLGLLVYDLVGWSRAASRGDRLARLEREPAP